MSSPSDERLVKTAFDQFQAGELDRAEWNFRKILSRQPRHAAAIQYLGLIAFRKGQTHQGAQLIRQAIALRPNVGEFHYNLGKLLQRLGQAAEAEQSFRTAIELVPHDVMAHNELATVLTEFGRVAEAEQHYRTVLAIHPDNTNAMSNLAGVLQHQGQLAEAVELYRAALSLAPQHVRAHSNMLLCLTYDDRIDAAELFAEHLRWAEAHASAIPAIPAAATIDADSKRRLRIGYLSADFREHPVAQFIRPVIESHDRAKFFVAGYSNTDRPDAVTDAIRARCDAWGDIAPLDDERAAALIREDRIDVLVDLAGHTANNRLLLFARRPAPMQVTWIGYPNTTGLKAIDYRITDAIADPPGASDALHTEKLLRLPDGFLCYRPPDDSPPPDREEGPITFASFNNFSKVTPRVIEAWAEVLKQVPQSRLMMKAKGLNEPATQQRTRDAFAALGVEPQRVEMSRQQPSHRDHLEQYRRVDVALDTFPYNGTTTTCEALWMGVPVVSLAGRTHVSRVGASLLSRVGLDEFVVDSADGYVRTAVALARDEARLRTLRAELRGRMTRSPLTDAPRFTRAYEEALRRMWAQRLSGLPR